MVELGGIDRTGAPAAEGGSITLDTKSESEEEILVELGGIEPPTP